MAWHRIRRRPAWWAALLLVGLFLGSALGGLVCPGRIGAATGTVASDSSLLPVTATLTVGSSLGTHPAAPFWSILTTAESGGAGLTRLGGYLNSTPFTLIRLGGASEAYDPTTTTDYEAPATGGTFRAVHTELTNFTWFKSWCLGRTPTCEWMTYLPGEENNTTAAAHVAKYFHNVLHFVPTVWQFGNEPVGWTHYGKNRTAWSTKDAIAPTGPAYAAMVKSYISAVTKLFPTDRFIGIQASCSCQPPLISNTAKVDGAKISSMAYHSFPWLTNSGSNLSQYYGALRGSKNLLNSTAQFRSTITSACPTCVNLPVDVGAYQAGPSYNLSAFSMHFAGAVFLAASTIQAIQTNVSTFTVFSIGYLFNYSSGTILPDGYLYQRLFGNLTMGTDYSVTVKATGVGGVFGLLVKNGTKEALLIVNTNTTKSFTLPIPTTVFATGIVGSYWTWTSSTTTPVAHRSLTIPTSFSVSAQEILLVTNY